MELLVNGKRSTPAPVSIIVAPYQSIPNLPPGYIEESRWTDGAGATVIRCWPADPFSDAGERASRIPRREV